MVYPKFDHLGKVIDEFDTELTHRAYTGSVTDDGYTDVSFSPTGTVRGMVRPAAAMDFEIGEHGRTDEETLYLLIRHQYDVEEHDRIVFDGFQWRLIEQQKEYLNDFSLYTMTPDGRGGTDPGTGETDDDNPFVPVE